MAQLYRAEHIEERIEALEARFAPAIATEPVEAEGPNQEYAISLSAEGQTRLVDLIEHHQPLQVSAAMLRAKETRNQLFGSSHSH